MQESLFRDRRHEDGEYAFRDTYGNKWTYKEIIRRSNLKTNPEIEFTNDARALAYAASSSGKSMSLRGTDDIISIFLSEAAHTGLTEDQPIMDALIPNLAQRSDADFIQETTGNGDANVS